MQEAFARPRVERDQAVAEEIGPFPEASVKVVLRARGRDVDDAARGVDRLLSPVVRATHGLPGILGPRVVAEFAGPGDGVKGPDLFSRADVERPDVARGRSVLFVTLGPPHH